MSGEHNRLFIPCLSGILIRAKSMEQYVLLLMYSVNHLNLISLLPVTHLLVTENCSLFFDITLMISSFHSHSFFLPSSSSSFHIFPRLFHPLSLFRTVLSSLPPVCLIRRGGCHKKGPHEHILIPKGLNCQ